MITIGFLSLPRLLPRPRFVPWCNHQVFVFKVAWTRARVREQWWGLGREHFMPPSSVPIDFLAWGKHLLVQARIQPGTSWHRVKRQSLPLRHTGSAMHVNYCTIIWTLMDYLLIWIPRLIASILSWLTGYSVKRVRLDTRILGDFLWRWSVLNMLVFPLTFPFPSHPLPLPLPSNHLP